MSRFFEEQREQSLIKARIVAKYFSAWANVILGAQKRYPQHCQKMAYIDLFAGPGRYSDDSKSTPILVLETILANPDLKSRMVTLFNDKDEANVESLKQAILQVSGIDGLKYKPAFYNAEVGDEIAKMFQGERLVPTFFFVDPWGYKGLSLDLVSSMIKDWGCDCVFFFNFNRIRMGITNEAVEPHISSIFGKERLDSLRSVLSGRKPHECEMIIVQSLCDSLRENGSKFVLPFRFKNDKGTRTSHHLIFLSKDFRGYDIMKEIMWKETTDHREGVAASFEYNMRDSAYRQGSLFDTLSRPLDELERMLIDQYSGKTIGFIPLYEEHSVNKPFVRKNYKDVLSQMLGKELIHAAHQKTGKPPRRGTFSDEMLITFRKGAKQ